MAQVMEAEAGDAAAVAGTLEAVIHGVSGIVDHIVIFMRRVGQQPADIGREAQPPVAAVGFGLLQLGAVLALHHGLLDDKSLALHAVPGESTNFGGAQAQPDGQEKGEFKLGAFAILVQRPNLLHGWDLYLRGRFLRERDPKDPLGEILRHGGGEQAVGIADVFGRVRFRHAVDGPLYLLQGQAGGRLVHQVLED